MALKTGIIEYPFASGQNEGTQRDVLPLGQLSYLQNARYRRNNRLGKRNGYTSLGRVDIAAATIGGTDKYVTVLGEKFTVVDDRFYRYDETGGAWGINPVDIAAGTVKANHLRNRWPQFMPAPAFQPLSVQSDLDIYTIYGTSQPSTASMTQAGGILYTCAAFWRYDPPSAGTWIVRVVGTDQQNGEQVFQQDLVCSGDQDDAQQPHLLSTGNGTVVLVTDHFTAAAKDGIRIRLMTSRATGFSLTEYTVACLQSAVNYYVGDSTHILITYSDGTAFTNLGNWDVTTQAFTHLETDTTGAEGVPEVLSVYGVSGGLSFVGFTGATSGDTRVRTYNSSLASLSMLSALNTKFGLSTVTSPVLFAIRPDDATSVVIIVCGEDASGYQSMCLTDATQSAYTGDEMTQAWVEPLSWPFPVGDGVYMWSRHNADAQLGGATLVRIPRATEYGTGFTPFGRSLPIEATLDDEDIDPPVEAAESGPTYPTPLSTDLGYIACLSPTIETFATPGPVTQAPTRPLLVPVKHRSDDQYQAQASVTPVAGKQFVASAQPMFVDARAAYEAGFVQAPVAPEFVATVAGGDLNPTSDYKYCALYEYRDANGRLEWSAPSLPMSASTTANQTIRFNVFPLELSKKVLRIKVYRTKANQSTFYLLATFDATPALHIGNPYTLDDTASDDVVGSNEQLYTQLGQELANSQFPACQFATEGGGRLWVGGGFKPAVIQASKQFHPRLSVAFADDDAFRQTLPAACTGMAWLDNLVAFTEEGIYVITGDGPDVAGVGSFSQTRLPFNIGCINWRSVIATDEGVFFQSARGMCLLPRGFAEPIPMDQVLDTLGDYPFITCARVIRTEQGERTVQWACVSTLDVDSTTAGVLLVYDTVRKLWSVDTFGASMPCTLISAWDGQRCLAQAVAAVDTHQFRLQSDAYSDAGTAIERIARTGDVRPWGTFSHGVINRIGVIQELESTCTATTILTTENGASTSTRVYTGGSDGAVGETQYLEVSMNKETLRDVNFLRIELSESSTTAGLALFGMVIEHDAEPQGFKLPPIRNRVT
jgi:hypothetical protein